MPESPKPTAILEIIAKYAIIISALLYFSGWIYLYYFFKQFHVEISLLSLSWNEIALHSISVLSYLSKWLWSWLGIILMVFFFPLAFYLIDPLLPVIQDKLNNIGYINRRIYAPTLLLIIAISFVMIAARAAANHNVAIIRAGDGDEVVFNFSCDAKELPVGLTILNDNWELRLLAANSRFHFIYARPTSRDAILDVFHVPSKCIGSTKSSIRNKIKE